MRFARSRITMISLLMLCGTSSLLEAQTLKITIPLRSELTPVQRLNREGVDAVLKRHYEEAETLFYKAYLYDPADPFTLNNLGYVSELQGQADRAAEFYKIAGSQGCDALIDRTTDKNLKGKPMMYALDTIRNAPLHVNRNNLLSIELLSQDRGFEAVKMLKEALAEYPANPFTLNNLGVAEEAVGDLEAAMHFYDLAASTHSKEPVVVTQVRSWRGKPVSEMAAYSASDLRFRMEKLGIPRMRSGMLAMRGVSELNRNNWDAAKKTFLEAYALDPLSAFSLNNLGYLAERDGDLETAKSFYERARRADDADESIGMATQFSAHGRNLADVAHESDEKVGVQLDAFSESQRGKKGGIELKRRNGEPLKPAIPAEKLIPTGTSPGSNDTPTPPFPR